MTTFNTTYVLTIISTVIGLSMIVLAVIWQILAYRVRSRLKRYVESLYNLEPETEDTQLDDDIDIWNPGD